MEGESSEEGKEFTESFPSFKKIKRHQVIMIPFTEGKNIATWAREEVDIEEHCHDNKNCPNERLLEDYKKKVKDLFQEVELAAEDDNYLAIAPAIEKFKKELGIQDEYH